MAAPKGASNAPKTEAEWSGQWARGGQGNIHKQPKAESRPIARNLPISGQNAEQPQTPAANGAES